MNARGQNFLRPNAKGMKPLINRTIARDYVQETFMQWRTKFKKASDVEPFVKKMMFGRVQFQFSSKTFTDSIPLLPMPGSRPVARTTGEGGPGHIYDNQLYMRKVVNPAKFKKLAIVDWEMPENYTKAVTLEELVQAGVQYGHTAAIWNPNMLRFLYTESDGSHIFDLVQTAANLNRACYYVMEAASKGATFFFTGTKEQAQSIIREAAERTGMPYCDHRFVGGLFTNYKEIQKGVVKMKTMVQERDQGAWETVSPQEKEKNELGITRLIKRYHGVEDMEGLPDILIFVDEVKERNAISECNRIGIPTIGLIDSNNRPENIDFPIPGNASGSRSIELVINKLTEAILVGQGLRAATSEGERPVIKKEWDPWLWSVDRLRGYRRRSKRQPFHKLAYGSYENWKKAHPFGRIRPVAPYRTEFSPIPQQDYRKGDIK